MATSNAHEQRVTLTPIAAKQGSKKNRNSSHLIGGSVLYVGFPVGCTYCAYGVAPKLGPVPRIPVAVVVVHTPRGPRELCAAHAKVAA